MSDVRGMQLMVMHQSTEAQRGVQDGGFLSKTGGHPIITFRVTTRVCTHTHTVHNY